MPIHETDKAIDTDIVIVGGGFAGCMAAIVLGRAGYQVTLIDIHATSPTLFRAEKVAGDQLTLLNECGILEDFKAVSTPVHNFINIRGKHIVDRPSVEEYCLSYAGMVDLLRRTVSSNVVFKQARVQDIEPSDDIQNIVLTDGEIIRARLVVLATGQGDSLRRKLGYEYTQVHTQKTICVGFSLKPPEAGFRFSALAAYGEKAGDNVDYVAFFPLGNVLRANLFLFSDIRDSRVTAIRHHGLSAIFDLLPGLRPWIADSQWLNDVTIFPVELYKCTHVDRAGVVLIGDAFRTSCPSVGTGLSCALVDVVRLRDHVEAWLKTPGMQATKIAAFYADPIKVARDQSAFQEAIDRRHAIMHTSTLHKMRRTAHFIKRGLRDRLHRGIISPTQLTPDHLPIMREHTYG